MNCFCEATASARQWLCHKRLYLISSVIKYCISPYASFYAGLSFLSNQSGAPGGTRSVGLSYVRQPCPTVLLSYEPCPTLLRRTALRSYYHYRNVGLAYVGQPCPTVLLSYEPCPTVLGKTDLRLQTLSYCPTSGKYHVLYSASYIIQFCTTFAVSYLKPYT